MYQYPKNCYFESHSESCTCGASSSLDVLETSVRNALEMTAAQSRYFKNLEAEREKILLTLIDNDDGSLQGRIQRVSECSAYPAVMATKFDRPVLVVGRCKDRMCPRCSRHNAWQMSKRLEQIMQRMQSRRMITLTLKHQPGELKTQIDRLMLGWRKIRKTSTWAEHVDGGIYSLEVTYENDSGNWHPHLHIIAEGRFFDQKILSELWQKVTGDSPIVDIRAVDSIKRAGKYVSKYVTKPDEVATWSRDLLWEYMKAIKGRRLFHTFGSLHNIKVTEEREKIEQRPGAGYAGIGRLIKGKIDGVVECIELFECLKHATRSWQIAFGISEDEAYNKTSDDLDFDYSQLDQLLYAATKRISNDYRFIPPKPPPPPTLFDNAEDFAGSAVPSALPALAGEH